MTNRIEKYLLFFLFAFSLSLKAFAQVDTEFWFAAPRLTPGHWDANSKVELVIVAYDEDALVSISQPASGTTFVANRSVTKGNVFTYVISNTISNFRQVIETPADEQVHNTGICVQSTTPVGVYYAVTAPNSEVYTLKGRHGCGTEFVVAMQNNFRQTKRNDRPTYDPYCSIEVVATEDNTVVTFVAPVATNYSAVAGTVHTVTLQRGQTYAISSRQSGTLSRDHLGGTLVTSTKPILVNSTDDSLSNSNNDTPAETGYDADLVGEQLVPTERAGSEYIVSTHQANNLEWLYFYAADPTDTNPIALYVNGNPASIGTVAPGAPLRYKAQIDSVYYVYSDDARPFICFQLTAEGAELSGTIMPALNCSGSQEVTYKPILTGTDVQFSIVTRAENIDYFLVNERNSTELEPADFRPVPGTNGAWYYCPAAESSQMLSGADVLTIRNTRGVFHIGALDGASGTSSFGYFSNFGQISLYANSDLSSYQQGDTVRFQLSAADEFTDIHWYKETMNPAHEILFTDPAHPMLTNVSLTDAGRYIVEATHREGCPTYPDTFYVTVFDTLSSVTRIDVCEGTSFTLTASGAAPYTWLDENWDEAGYTQHLIVSPTDTTSYTVEENMRGVSRIDWAQTSELSLPDMDSLVLWKERVDNLIPTAQYVWSLHFVAPQNNTVAPKIHIYVGDQLLDRFVVPNGATGVDTSYIISPMGSEELYLRVYVVSPRVSQHLALTSMTFLPVMPVWETFEINVDAPPMPTIAYQSTGAPALTTTGPFELVQGETATLSVTGVNGADAYRWSTGEETESITIAAPGTYIVYVYRGMCMEADTIEVIGVLPDPVCPDPTYADPFEVTICSSYLPYRWRGKYYDEEGTYGDTLRQTNEDGSVCDIRYFELRLTVLDCTPKEEDFRVELLNPDIELCDGDEPDFDLHVLEGELDHIDYTLPATPGIWPMTITCYSTDNKTVTLQATITIYYDPERVFAQMWDDVLAIFSPDYSGYEYAWTTDYQWYRNGQPIPGATGSYYYLSGDTLAVTDYYQVEITRVDDNVRLLTCPYFPTIPVYSNAPAVQKVLQDTHLYIIRDNRRYTPQGQLIK